jgi:hypothetical protein
MAGYVTQSHCPVTLFTPPVTVLMIPGGKGGPTSGP